MIIAAGIFLAAIVFIYYFLYFESTSSKFFPYCQFKSLTQLECPGCGGQRAFSELLKGNFINALNQNALFILSVPIIAYYSFYGIRRYLWEKPAPNNFMYTSKFAVMFIVIVLLFMILRNIPVFPFSYLHSD